MYHLLVRISLIRQMIGSITHLKTDHVEEEIYIGKIMIVMKI